MGIQGNLFEDPLAREGHPSRFFEKFKEFGIIFSQIGKGQYRKCHGKGKGSMTRATEFVNTITVLPQGAGVQIHASGIYSDSGMINHARFPISEMHLAKFPDPLELES